MNAAEAMSMRTKTTHSVFLPESEANSWMGWSGSTEGMGATCVGLAVKVAVGRGNSDVFFKTSSNESTIMAAVGDGVQWEGN